MYYMGIDIGSLSCDAVLIDDNGGVVAATVVPTGARNLQAIDRARQEVLQSAQANEDQIGAVVATGYGRDRVEGRLASVTEITCHAKGIQKLLPGTDILIDIGGQDSKAIHFDSDGMVSEFAMNDKCAAGTGRFLEAMARALETDVDSLGSMDQDRGDMVLSSMCTVFAESEVVSLIADGTPVDQIVSALHRSIATRTVGLVKRVCPHIDGKKIAMSGGVAHNFGVVNALGRMLNCTIQVPTQPDIVGALGAALIAKQRTKSK